MKSLWKTHSNNDLTVFPQRRPVSWQSSQGLFFAYWTGWISYTEQKIPFLPANHGVLGHQPTPGGDRAVTVCHPWAVSPCIKEQRGGAAFCLQQEFFKLFAMDRRAVWRVQGHWYDAIDIDPARNNSKWTCNMNGGVSNIEGRDIFQCHLQPKRRLLAYYSKEIVVSSRGCICQDKFLSSSFSYVLVSSGLLEAVKWILCVCKIYLPEENCQVFAQLLVRTDEKQKKGGRLTASQSLGCPTENWRRQLQDWLLITEKD